MHILEQINPVVNKINHAKHKYERLGRERVLALVLQSEGYTHFPFKPKTIGLKTRPKEPLSSTVERIENMKFNYTPLEIPKIIRTLSTIQPASYCRKAGHTRIANKITESGCREEGSLFDLYLALQRLGPPTSSWQESFIRARHLGVKSKNIFAGLLENRGIDANISRAEVDYFRQQAHTPTPSKQ